MVKLKSKIKSFTNLYENLDLYEYFFPKWVHIEQTFDETKYMSFLIKGNKLLEKYKEICEKVRKSIKKDENKRTKSYNLR